MTRFRLHDPARARSATDPIGVAASGLCAVHCVLCTALPGVLGVLGLEVFLGHEVEWCFTIAAVLFASLSLTHGWRHHRSPWIAATLLAGITGLLVSRAVEHVEPTAAHTDHATVGHDPGHESHGHGHGDGHVLGAWLGVLGGMLLVGGHLQVIRASRRSAHCCE